MKPGWSLASSLRLEVGHLQDYKDRESEKLVRLSFRSIRLTATLCNNWLSG